MSLQKKKISAPRREWLVPGLWDGVVRGRPPAQIEDATYWSLPLGSIPVGDGGTKILANGLVRVAQERDPTAPPGVITAAQPMGPYTIERIVGSLNVSTGATSLTGAVYLGICAVFDTGNPYEAAGTAPSIDRLRTQEGVMHCASGIITADSSGPAVDSYQMDVRTKRVVVPGKSFYLIVHTANSEGGTEENIYWPLIKVLVRYA